MSRICQITGKKGLVGNNVAHSNKKAKRVFHPNVFKKRFYLSEEDRWVTLNVSAAGMKIINKKGLKAALERARKNGYIKKY
ncbi:MAG: 50S ribosomal protein L28 [Bacteroidales bacterium]